MVEPHSLSKDQRLLLLACHPDTVEVGGQTPDWLVDECVALGLIKRVGNTGAIRLTVEGEQTRAALLA